MEQTAVSWLVHQIGPFLEMDKSDAIKVIEQAKAMEKEQIKNAWMSGQLYYKYDYSLLKMLSDEYYQKNHNKNNINGL